MNMFDTFNALWRRFAAEGVIRDEEYVGLTSPTISRPSRSLPSRSPTRRAPCIGRSCAWSSGRRAWCRARLPPRSASMVTRRASPVNTSRRCGHGVRARFWPRSRQDRLAEERQAIIERYYGAYEALVRENPAGHRKDLVHIYMTIAKTGA